VGNVDNADLLERARQGFEIAGRGVLVQLRNEELRYAPIEEMKAKLAEARAEPDLLTAVIYASSKYDPKWEAVLFTEEIEGFMVFIVRTSGAEAVGGTATATVN
jgi:hypothetical protein